MIQKDNVLELTLSECDVDLMKSSLIKLDLRGE